MTMAISPSTRAAAVVAQGRRGVAPKAPFPTDQVAPRPFWLRTTAREVLWLKSPKGFQVNMRIRQFVRCRSKKRKRAARSEMYADDGSVLPRINHKRSAVSPGNDCP